MNDDDDDKHAAVEDITYQAVIIFSAYSFFFLSASSNVSIKNSSVRGKSSGTLIPLYSPNVPISVLSK